MPIKYKQIHQSGTNQIEMEKIHSDFILTRCAKRKNNNTNCVYLTHCRIRTHAPPAISPRMRAKQNRTEQIKLGFIFHFKCAITAVSIKCSCSLSFSLCVYCVCVCWDQLVFRRIENQEMGKKEYWTNNSAQHSVKVEYNRFNKKKCMDGTYKERIKGKWIKNTQSPYETFLFTNFLVSVFAALFVKRSYTRIALFQRCFAFSFTHSSITAMAISLSTALV